MELSTNAAALIAIVSGAVGVIIYIISVLIEGNNREKMSAMQQSTRLPDGTRISKLCTPANPVRSRFNPDVRTTLDVFNHGLNNPLSGPCLGSRAYLPDGPYKWLTYTQVSEMIKEFGSGLMHIGVEAGQNTHVGIYLSNSVEFVVTDFACCLHSMVNVPLYDTLGSQALSFIINQAELGTIVCENCDKAQNVLNTSSSIDHKISNLIISKCKDAAKLDDLKSKAAEKGINVHSFKEVCDFGKETPHEATPCKPEDLAVIMYTSGTTGNPKGVMMTHESIVALISALQLHVKPWIEIDTTFINISYLPLAHGLEKTCELYILSAGGRIGFFSGNIKNLTKDIIDVKPKIVPMVPRVLNRIYDNVMGVVSKSLIRKGIFKAACLPLTPQWVKSLVFAKVRAQLGGNLEFIVVGAAPVDHKALVFARTVLGATVVEAYGLSEAVSACTAAMPLDTSQGSVGPVLCCLQCKLIDVPDMNYYAKDDMGEICFKGASVMKGYYKEPEKTREAIDDEGWLRTGDIGVWNPNGTLRIIDRKKDIFKLAQGEYIAPEKIENVYVKVPYIAQVFVHGDSLKSQLVGLIFPDHVDAMKHFSSYDSFEDLCASKAVKETIIYDMNKVARKNNLAGFEQIKAFRVMSNRLTVEGGLLTPTFKTKRAAIKKHYSDILEQLYKELES